MTRFGDYRRALTDGGPTVDWRYELIDADGDVLATTDPDGDGLHFGLNSTDLEFNSNRIAQRTSTLSGPVTEPRFIPTAESALHPDSDNRIRSYMGIEGPDGQTVWFLQATAYLDEAEAVYDGSTSIAIRTVDSVEPVRSNMSNPHSFDAGEDIAGPVRRILSDVLAPHQYAVPDTGCTLSGGGFPIGKDRSEAIDELLEACGWELVATPEGLVIAQEVPPTGDDPTAERWAYGAPGGIPVDEARRVWRRRTPEAWKIEGGSLRDSAGTVIDRLVFDGDPRSEGFAQPGTPGRTIGTTRIPFITTNGQADIAGFAKLRRGGSGPMMVTFQTIANPAIRPNDLLDLQMPALKASGAYRVKDYSLPLENERLMTITARGVWEPNLNFDPPQPVRPGCDPSVLDTFDRPNGNLENLPGSPGSLEWTEIGISWFVQGNEAIQRIPDAWCLAFRTRPLCSTDHTVTATIGHVPRGRRVGPVARCSGQFDGYAALTDSSGRVKLEVWQNGVSIDTLGQHDFGRPLDGLDLAVTVVGESISVSVAGSSVIRGVDRRRAGGHVGMLAFGGRAGSTAPRVASFAANAA